jgi:hypothetical protein
VVYDGLYVGCNAKMNQTIEQRCPNCGAGTKSFWHRLTPGLVSCLVAAIRAVHVLGKNEFHLQKDLVLSKTQYTNFHKLRYHALIAKVEGKPGVWLITTRGGQFLRGETAVPIRVLTFRNRIQERSTEMVHIDELRGKIPEFEKEFAYEYRRAQYLWG